MEEENQKTEQSFSFAQTQASGKKRKSSIKKGKPRIYQFSYAVTKANIHLKN